MEDDIVLVLDHGSTSSRVGFAGEEKPHTVFPTVVGRPKRPGYLIGMPRKDDAYVGAQCLPREDILSLNWPIQQGMVTNWEDMDKVLQFSWYDCLRMAPEEHLMLLTEVPFTPQADRSRLAQLLFETHAVPGFYVAQQAVLALYGQGLTSGLSIDIGHTATHLAPVSGGRVLSHAVLKWDWGGARLTARFRELLSQRGYPADLALPVVQEMKERYGYVALDYEAELKASGESCTNPQYNISLEKLHELADGQVVAFGSERFQSAEALFDPRLLGRTEAGLAHLAHDAIQRCRAEQRPELFGSVLLSGATCQLPGLAQRLQRELGALAPLNQPPQASPNVTKPEAPATAVWRGGSKFAAQSNFAQLCVSKQEYEEAGADVVETKCPACMNPDEV